MMQLLMGKGDRDIGKKREAVSKVIIVSLVNLTSDTMMSLKLHSIFFAVDVVLHWC